MKRLITLTLLVLMLVTVTGCGDTMVVDGIEYDTHGLLNQDDKKNPDIEYELIVGNLVWGAILFGTVIAPIYFFGFDLFEPVGKKLEVKGQVVS